MAITHTPVLPAETLTYLKVRPSGRYVDGTAGSGGHLAAILKSAPNVSVIGVDRDPATVAHLTQRFQAEPRVRIFHGSYETISNFLGQLGSETVDGILLDLGLSSPQLADPMRGMSFQTNGPLDLRYDPNDGQSAAAKLSRWSPEELGRILRDYGELRAPRALAQKILAKWPIQTTQELVAASGLKNPKRLAQLFQALRIATNDELGTLERALPRLWQVLATNGRLVVISFHSLEDRIVKRQFQAWDKAGQATILTKKPVVASDEEVQLNPRSRSAKLRAIQKN